ncbi:MAG TPA: hypothetical protein VFI38_19095 [Candidatus Acidoferrum sp.]|nr:hypothetical protein [Candidatus Acidoferrum sp.]
MSQSQVISSPGNLAATSSRRSTRIEKSVPLIVLGQNRLGEPFMERTVSVTLNMHGCRYASRHDYGVGTWVTLQMVGLNSSEEKPATVRAIVRSVHPPASLRELQQVGVELESPANVWGIALPPEDWQNIQASSTSTAKLEPLVAPTQESPAKKVREITMKPDSKVSEITSSSSPSPAVSPSPAPAASKPDGSQRAVVTPEKLIAALQERLQQEAEKAVQAAATKQVSGVVRDALASIEEARRSSVREMQELLPKQLEAMKLSLKTDSAKELSAQWSTDLQKYRGRAEETAQRLEKQSDDLHRELANAQTYVDKLMQEVGPSIPAKLKETMARAASEFENAADEIAESRHERLLENLQAATEAALSKLNAHSAEVQTLAQNAANSRLEEFRRDTEAQVNKTLAQSKELVDCALSLLEAQSQTTCDTRRQALEAEIARSAEEAAQQFHKKIKAFLHTCLSATDGVVDEHSQSTTNKRAKDSD